MITSIVGAIVLIFLAIIGLRDNHAWGAPAIQCQVYAGYLVLAVGLIYLGVIASDIKNEIKRHIDQKFRELERKINK